MLKVFIAAPPSASIVNSVPYYRVKAGDAVFGDGKEVRLGCRRKESESRREHRLSRESPSTGMVR